MDPFDRLIAAFREHGRRVILRGADHARCGCPLHPDARPSIGVTRQFDRVLLQCFSCGTRRTSEILAALGLRKRDLFNGPRQDRPPRAVDEYDYVDPITGELIATKVRFEPKSFKWRSPDGSWSLKAGLPGLYGLADVVDGPRQVLAVEGEKAVERVRHLNERLRQIDLFAVCPPAGASSWRAEWSESLWRAGIRELIVLPDADRAGREHAQRVAELTCGVTAPITVDEIDEPWADWPVADPDDSEVAPLAVKVVSLPDLPPGGDLVDWLDAGHTPGDLRALIAKASLWTPDGDQRARLERRRQLGRERTRRCRMRKREQLGQVLDVRSGG